MKIGSSVLDFQSKQKKYPIDSWKRNYYDFFLLPTKSTESVNKNNNKKNSREFHNNTIWKMFETKKKRFFSFQHFQCVSVRIYKYTFWLAHWWCTGAYAVR